MIVSYSDFRSSRVAVLVWALLLFTVCCFLNSRHNDFPYYYHPDEPGKVEQVMTSHWNFNHPMLLLSATKLAVELFRVPMQEQAIVEAGRDVSVVFMAVAVVALSVLALQWRGWAAGVIAGGTLALHHQLFELAHYMKEDSALLMGVSLTALASFVYWQRRSTRSAAALGIACGLAVSGKYIGAVALVFAVAAFASPPRPDFRRHLAWCVGGFLLTLALVNAPLLANLATFRTSFDREVDFVVHGQRGMTRSVPHWQYWNIFIDNTTPAIWVLLLVLVVSWLQRRKNLRPVEWTIFAFPFALGLALSFSPKSNDRYFLPATAVFTVLAALGCVELARRNARRWNPVVVIWIAGAALVLGQLPSWVRYERAYQHDDTQELIDWLRTELSPDAVIAKDNRILLPNPEKKRDAARLGVIPQKVIASRYAADLGTLDELRAKGITHVAVSESDFGRFFVKSLRPQKGEEQSFNRRKAFYEQLFREGRRQFERDRGTVIYLHPGIIVYQIADPKPPAVPASAPAPPVG